MTELERLKAERKALDERIKALSGVPIYKRCKIDVEHYPTEKPSRYFLAVKYFPIEGRAKYQTIFSAKDRESVVRAIPEIIEELQGLYDLTKEALTSDERSR